MKILLVEDEVNVVSFVKRGLFEAGHEVSVAMDGTTAHRMIESDVPDLVLLDVMLPGINGIELCRRVRLKGISVPIIMLTALGTSENVVDGLESGADDYMIKPFKFTELLARITAVTRRANGMLENAHLLRIDDLVIDTRGKSVQRAGERIPVTATEFNLIEFLVRNKGRVYTRSQILEHVWDISFEMTTNVVDVYITYLRKKIDRKHTTKLIHTVVGMGYVVRMEEQISS